MILKSQSIRILEYLQDNNATTDNLETNGKTLTDLAEFGLNKTQAHKHLPELKTQQLIVSKQIPTRGRPADNYGITPIGSLLVFKHRLEDKSYEDECNELEEIQKSFPLITKYWNGDQLVDFGNLRYKALFNAIDRLETRIRDKHYFSLSMTLQKGDRFLTFEKTYVLVTTPKEEKTVQGFTLDVDDTLRKFAEAPQTKRPTVENIEKDLKDFVTFQFYYNLMIFPNETNKLVKDLEKGVRKNKISEGDYHKILIQHTIEYRKSLGISNQSDPKQIEVELKEISERLLFDMQTIFKNDRALSHLITNQKTMIRDTSNKILNQF